MWPTYFKNIISRDSGTRSFLSEKDIISLIYKTTPPPDLFRSLRTILYSFILISLSGIESSIFYSFIARISMEELLISTRSSSMCFRGLLIFKLAILKPLNLIIACRISYTITFGLVIICFYIIHIWVCQAHFVAVRRIFPIWCNVCCIRKFGNRDGFR